MTVCNADGLQSDFQLIDHLRLWLEFMVLFQHGIETSQSCDTLGSMHLFIDLGKFTCSQFCVTLRMLRNG